MRITSQNISIPPRNGDIEEEVGVGLILTTPWSARHLDACDLLPQARAEPEIAADADEPESDERPPVLMFSFRK